MNAKTILATTLLLMAVKAGCPAELKKPVLLELFTSEGCSSCPPADKLLQKLDRQQPVEGADLVVLSEHVDYWNRLGWRDPYSSAEFSKRQQDYAEALDSEVYTPQLVIDGRKQVVGSDAASVEHSIRESLRKPKILIGVNARREADQITVHFEVAPDPGSTHAAVYLVLAENEARSHVVRGENAGKDLEHVAVVQSITKVANITHGSALQKDVQALFKAVSPDSALRVVVFVQDTSSHRIIGVGQARL